MPKRVTDAILPGRPLQKRLFQSHLMRGNPLSPGECPLAVTHESLTLPLWRRSVTGMWMKTWNQIQILLTTLLPFVIQSASFSTEL